MKLFNAPQLCFIVLVQLLITFFVSNALVVLFLGGTLKQAIAIYDYSNIWAILFEDHGLKNPILAGIKAIASSFAFSCIMPIALLLRLNLNVKASLHGDAKFASLKDIRNSESVSINPNNKKGIIVGKYQGKLVKYLKPDFVSLGAGTRSGKGASVVIPNLLEWQDSLIVLDIKQECFNITSKYRKETLKQDVFLFAPFSFNTHKFNPLFYVDLRTPEGSTDLMGLGEIIFPTDSVTGTEKHFNNAAQSLFIALSKSLWIIIRYNSKFLQEYSLPSIFSIGNLVHMYSTVSMGDVSATLTENLELSKLDQNGQMLCNDAIAKIRSFMLLEGEGKASVISTFEKQLKLFSLPVIQNATNDNSFDFRDMRRKKMSIYLSVEPKNIKISSLILNLFFNCAIKINLTENPDFNPDLKHNLLLILDEFPAIGNIPYVKEASGYIAGYKLQLLTIFQNVSQLNEIYGMQGRKTLLANHSCKIVFAPNEQDDAEYFSNEIAFITAKSSSESKNHGNRSNSRGESLSETKRPLMLPQELKLMPFAEEVILLNGENPIKCEKALYFNDPYFMRKLIALSPTLQLYTQGNKLPTKEALGIAMSENELAICM